MATGTGTAPGNVGERTITAFLDGEDSPDISNPIHSTAGATAYGYKAALVGGVTVYGWTVPAILQAAGEVWLDDGWIDVSFRKPTFPGDVMTARVAPEQGADTWSLTMSNQDGAGCLVGQLGRGTAPWLGELNLPVIRPAEDRPGTLPRLTPEVAPIGQQIRPMAVSYSYEVGAEYVIGKQRDNGPLWVGEGSRIHPGWIAARMTPLLHHSYDYGPAIHTRSQIQNLAPAMAGRTVTMCGYFVETFQRKEHWYGVIDGVMVSESGEQLARLRHTTIYQVAKRG